MKRNVYITNYKDKQMMALYEDDRLVELYADSLNEPSLLDRIYIGKVKNIVKNISAAFVDLGGIEGYYSLKENPVHLYTNGKDKNAPLVPGDEIVVQVCRENIKTKVPALTSSICLSGKYMVIKTNPKDDSANNTKISISSKITDKAERMRLNSIFLNLAIPGFDYVVRTKAKQANTDVLKAEIEALSEKMKIILRKSQSLKCYSEVYKEPLDYIKRLMDLEDSEMEKIETDIPELYKELKTYHIGEIAAKGLVLYQDDSMPLIKLLSLETQIDRALHSQVWLKSGGSLVINVTEALTVIDVNTGRYTGKKSQEETFYKINIEAAKEIARQLRLRNLSGIIIIDFIDMKSKDMQKDLMETLAKETSKDPIKTVIVDMTKLNLVEMTRKKSKRPLHEQLMVPCTACKGRGYLW